MPPKKDKADIAIGRCILTLRESRAMTRTELAERARLTESSVRALERGERRATAGEVWRLCEIFGVSPMLFFKAASGNGAD